MSGKSLSIKNIETCSLARELAELTGESLTTAVSTAIGERLQRIKRRKVRSPNEIFKRAQEIAEKCSSLKLLDSRSADEILGYDEHGSLK